MITFNYSDKEKNFVAKFKNYEIELTRKSVEKATVFLLIQYNNNQIMEAFCKQINEDINERLKEEILKLENIKNDTVACEFCTESWQFGKLVI